MEHEYDPAGRSLLKITGVLMLIFGILGVLIYMLGLAAVAGLSYVTSGIFSASRDLIGLGLLFSGAVAELVSGIFGVKAAKRPARSGKGLFFWGILTLLLTLAGVGHIALRVPASAPLWELILGLVLSTVVPIVYLVGAVLIKHSVSEAIPDQTE